MIQVYILMRSYLYEGDTVVEEIVAVYADKAIASAARQVEDDKPGEEWCTFLVEEHEVKS